MPPTGLSDQLQICLSSSFAASYVLPERHSGSVIRHICHIGLNDGFIGDDAGHDLQIGIFWQCRDAKMSPRDANPRGRCKVMDGFSFNTAAESQQKMEDHTAPGFRARCTFWKKQRGIIHGTSSYNNSSDKHQGTLSERIGDANTGTRQKQKSQKYPKSCNGRFQHLGEIHDVISIASPF